VAINRLGWLLGRICSMVVCVMVLAVV
jgi:hypothetical protein